MDAHTKVSGVWKKLEGIHVRVSGTWKEVENGFIRVSGAWKQFYAAVTYQLVSGDIDDISVPSPTRAEYQLQNDGDEWSIKQQGADADEGNWIEPKARADNGAYVRCTVNSGTLSGGDATGSWIALSTTRAWYVTQAGTGVTTANITVEIATDSGGTDVRASNTLDLHAQVL